MPCAGLPSSLQELWIVHCTSLEINCGTADSIAAASAAFGDTVTDMQSRRRLRTLVIVETSLKLLGPLRTTFVNLSCLMVEIQDLTTQGPLLRRCCEQLPHLETLGVEICTREGEQVVGDLFGTKSHHRALSNSKSAPAIIQTRTANWRSPCINLNGRTCKW